MRVSDDRYDRDRLRFDLAMRMIRHEARTCTIRAWTGLSDDRIRKLYRAYLLGQHVEPVRRHRGKSPQQVEYFLRSPAVLFEATTLASLYCMLGLLPGNGHGHGAFAPGVERGEQFCEAYETYLALHRPARVSFEHACFLLLALMRREELELAHCEPCGRLYLRDVLGGERSTCNLCRGSQALGRRSRRPSGRPIAG
jgi:Flagellar transcriptional activator (FlhC)